MKICGARHFNMGFFKPTREKTPHSSRAAQFAEAVENAMLKELIVD